jgi:Phage tail tube protein, GTA-gp10
MASNGELTLAWADGEHKFNIAKLKCVLELEEKCGCGVAEIILRLREGRWHFNDIRETVRLGLIGSGMLPDKALMLVQRYVDERPWAENVLIAQAIIYKALIGEIGDNPEKKANAEGAKENRSSETTVDMPAPSSTDSEPPSDSTRVN